jgi:hypothetical protein
MTGADTVVDMGADYGPQSFDKVSWWTLGIMVFVIVGGIGFLTYPQPGFIALGAVLLIVGASGFFGVLGSRHLEISDAGITTHQFYRWSHTYPRSEVQRAADDWSLSAFSLPLLHLKNGHQVRLWGVSRPTLFLFRTSRYTAEIVTAINRSLAYRTDSAD